MAGFLCLWYTFPMPINVTKNVNTETVDVPTVDEFNELKEKVDAIPTSNTSVKEHPWEIVVTEGFNDAAIKAGLDKVLSGRNGNAVQKTLILPPGDFHLKNPLFTQTRDNTSQIEGLSVKGQGKRLTKIFVDATPGDVSDPLQNNFISAHGLRYFSLRDFTVISGNEKNNFAYLWSLATGPYNQEWNIESVEFQGAWNRVLGIDGDATANLNSEFVIDRISTATNSKFVDAFFRLGGISQTTNQQNQFLNYWITNSQFVLTEGTVFRFDKGGSVRIARGSWSAAAKNDKTIRFFHMPAGNYNNRSATQLSVRDIRFEPKAPTHKIIDCAWGNGAITFDDCADLGSAQTDAGMEYNLHRYVGQSPWGFGVGPTVRYNNCALVGYHTYEGPAQKLGSIVYDGCYFYRGGSGNMAKGVNDPKAALRWTNGAPRYRFAECDNIENVNS